MKPEMRAKILAYNRVRAEDKAKADDLVTLLGALPPGQVKNLLKDEVCKEILQKHGITGV
jgi:hypothetical protein